MVTMNGNQTAEMANERLRSNPYPPIRRLTCACEDDCLILLGQVQTYYHKQVAQETVAQVNGVRQVINRIEVVSRSDQM